MPDGPYDHDVLAWAERQSDLLIRLAAGERVNALVDWPNVIDEVRDVGLSELKRVESLTVQAMTYLMKMHRWPEADALNHWRGEIVAFLQDAKRSYTPSMRQKIDLPRLFTEARSRCNTVLPETCPYQLDELLNNDPDPATLASKLMMN